MIAKKDVLAGLLSAAAIVAGVCYVYPPFGQLLYALVRSDSTDSGAQGSNLPAVPPQVVEAELVKIREAEKIVDPVQRCLAYPTPPEFHWDPKVVDAFCQLLSRKSIGLKDIGEALTAGRPRALQQQFDAYLAQTFEPGQHGFLSWVYWAQFGNSSSETLATIQRWIDADPDSAYALAARGTYYVAAAGAARGPHVAADTPVENFQRMHELVAKARVDLDEALRRNPRLIAAHVALINAAQLSGDHALLGTSIQNALALDPADQRLYTNWMNAVEPKWGGSEEEMEKVAQEAQRHVADNPLLSRLATRSLCSQAERADSPAERLELYRRAAASFPTTCFLDHAGGAAEGVGQFGAAALYYSQAYRFLGVGEGFYKRAEMLERLNKWAWALETLDSVLQANPKDARALTNRAWLLMNQGKLDEGELALLAVLDVDPLNSQAAMELAPLYAQRALHPDKARQIIERMKALDPTKPRPWLLEGLLDKDSDPKSSRAALQKYLQLVDPRCACEDHNERDMQLAKSMLERLQGEAAQ